MSTRPAARIGTVWEEQLLPRLIDVVLAEKVTGRWRERICDDLAGSVLEVGFGSGTNLGHYPEAVEEILVVEPSDVAWARSAQRRRAFEHDGRRVRRIGLDGARIALDDDSVDAVVSTYTMCTIPDLDGALGEFARVLREGAALHFVEHSLAPDPEVERRQRRIQPVWGRLAGGCHLVRDIPALVTDAGFGLTELETFYAPGPKFARPFGWLTIGRAATTS